MAEESTLPGVRDPGDGYELLGSDPVYSGFFLQVIRNRIRLPNGHTAEHEILRHPVAVTIVPVLEETPGHPEVVMVEQFRSSLEGYIHEIPAGILETGEDPLETARRELLEETGYSASRWTHIFSIYPTPGIASQPQYYYLAEGLRKEASPNLDPGECLTVKRFPLSGLLESMVLGRKVPGIPVVVDGKSHIGIFYLGARLGFLAGGTPSEETRG